MSEEVRTQEEWEAHFRELGEKHVASMEDKIQKVIGGVMTNIKVSTDSVSGEQGPEWAEMEVKQPGIIDQCKRVRAVLDSAISTLEQVTGCPHPELDNIKDSIPGALLTLEHEMSGLEGAANRVYALAEAILARI